MGFITALQLAGIRKGDNNCVELGRAIVVRILSPSSFLKQILVWIQQSPCRASTMGLSLPYLAELGNDCHPNEDTGLQQKALGISHDAKPCQTLEFKNVMWENREWDCLMAHGIGFLLFCGHRLINGYLRDHSLFSEVI